MIISMSVFLVVCHYILSAYSVNISTKLLYIALWLWYILLFIFFFWEWSFKDLRWYLKSRRFKRFVASNTYNILSLLVIFFTVSGLAYKFGYFDNIFKKTPVEVVVETPVEEPIEQVITVEEIEPEVPTTRVVVKQIRDVYNFTNRLEVWSEWEEVSRLQWFLWSMEYLESEPTWVFDEETRVALRDTLMEKCDWPESTQWVLGNQAMACINNLEVQVVEDIPEGESAEETIEELSEENQEVEVEVIDTPEVEPEVVEETPVVEESTPESEVVIPEETTPEPEPAAPIIEEVEPEPETTPEVTEDEPDTNTTQIRRVSDIYIFTETLQAWNTGNGVSNLKDILSVLGYYRWELSPDFDEETRIALRNTLIAECNWPESTKWILGPQARSCINTIELPNQ